MEVLGLFGGINEAAGAVDRLLQEGFKEEAVTSMTSVPYPDGALVRTNQHHWFHWVSAAGALVGAAVGFLLAAGTAWLYPLYTGAKPIVSLFPVGIIAFEFAMLLAILGGVVGMFVEMGLPGFLDRAYDPEISEGKIGICVRCDSPAERDSARKILEGAGASRLRIAGRKK